MVINLNYVLNSSFELIVYLIDYMMLYDDLYILSSFIFWFLRISARASTLALRLHGPGLREVALFQRREARMLQRLLRPGPEPGLDDPALVEEHVQALVVEAAVLPIQGRP